MVPLHHMNSSEERISFLLDSAKCGGLGHAYLFVGPELSGKIAAATTLISALPSSEVIRCTPPEEEGSKSDSISITQIRDMLASLSFMTALPTIRVIWIEPAEALTKEAANALLKNLEEPYPDTLFLLFANSVRTVLPTIASRCAIVRFPILQKRLEKESSHLDEFLSQNLVQKLRMASTMKKEELPLFENAIMNRLESANTSDEFRETIRFYQGLCSSYRSLKAHLSDQAYVDMIYL